jgi:plasmid stabilization system protein ParE
MKLRFTPRALANIVEIADYIHEHSPAAAQRVLAASMRARAKLPTGAMLDVANLRQDAVGEHAQRAHDLFLRQRAEVDQ